MKPKWIYLFSSVLILFTSCKKSNNKTCVGKWNDNFIDTIDDVQVRDQQIVEFKKDSTFQATDEISATKGDAYFELGNLNNAQNNLLIEKTSGTWKIKDDSIVYNCTVTNTGLEPGDLDYSSEKIIESSENRLITEQSDHTRIIYTRIDDSAENNSGGIPWARMIFFFGIALIGLLAYLDSRKPKIDEENQIR